MTKVRIIGPGRTGRSLERAFGAVGIDVTDVLGRDDDPSGAATGVDALMITVPDGLVASVAAKVRPVPSTAVVHCSGALGLDVLAPHERVASLHPLATLPDPVIGAVRLRTGGYFVVAGDQLATDLALALGGHPLVLPTDQRAGYHAAACIASNHLVALLGQVQRVAANVGLPLEAFLPLARGALDDVELLGPTGALTGPAARGDLATIDRHRQVLHPAELEGYDAGVDLARRLAASAEPPSYQPATSVVSDGTDSRPDPIESVGSTGTSLWR